MATIFDLFALVALLAVTVLVVWEGSNYRSHVLATSVREGECVPAG